MKTLFSDEFEQQKARKASNNTIDWIITKDGKDYSDNKAMYICRWLNHSFRPFTPKQLKLAEDIITNYKKTKEKSGENNV